jgi:hypothetical protein
VVVFDLDADRHGDAHEERGTRTARAPPTL